MKLSDWKSRVQALFRSAQHENANPSHQHHAPLAANNTPKPVEILIPSTGKRFIHDPSLANGMNQLDLSDDAQADIDLPDIGAVLARDLAENIQRWNGRSVRDISTQDFYDYPELESHPALQKTVPFSARQELWHPFPEDAAYRTSITVLAIDRAGEVLIKHYAVDDSRDADGWSYSTVPLAEATQLLRQHGLIENVNIQFARNLLDGSVHVEAAVPGATYRGPIQSIENDVVYQATGTTTAIEHKVGKLAIDNLHQLIGKEVEINYPWGQVGLVRQVDGMAHTTAEWQKFAEKTADGLER